MSRDEHERHLLSAALQWPEMIPEGAAVVAPEDFINPKLASAWRASVELSQASQPIHPLAVAEQAANGVRAEDLRALYGLAITGQQIGYHARAVREAAVDRRVRQVLEEGLRDTERRGAELAAAVQARIAQVETAVGPEAPTVRDTMMETVDRLEALAQEGETGLRCGFDGFDRRLGGLPRGSLITIAARPSVGKSSLCAAIARQAAMFGSIVDIYSLEDTRYHVQCRMIAQQSEVPLDVILRGSATAEQWQAINQAAAELYNQAGGVLIDDAQPRSIGRLIVTMFRNALHRATDLIVVDYFQLLGDPAVPRNRSRSEELASVSAQLKDAAKRLNVAMVLAAQLRRDADDHPPQLRDLKDSGALEQDSDVVLMLERPEDLRDDEGAIPGVIARLRKVRNGPTGGWFFSWNAKCVRFDDADEGLAARLGQWLRRGDEPGQTAPRNPRCQRAKMDRK